MSKKLYFTGNKLQRRTLSFRRGFLFGRAFLCRSFLLGTFLGRSFLLRTFLRMRSLILLNRRLFLNIPLFSCSFILHFLLGDLVFILSFVIIFEAIIIDAVAPYQMNRPLPIDDLQSRRRGGDQKVQVLLEVSSALHRTDRNSHLGFIIALALNLPM